MNENAAIEGNYLKIEGADFQALSSIGLSGKSHYELATEIVIAMIQANMLSNIAVPDTFKAVFRAISDADVIAEPAPAEPEIKKPTQAEIKKSITPDALISFLDGKPYKTLKRHLSKHGLDPYGYRTRYGLPNDYPMTAPGYSEQRAALARSIGLGVPGAQGIRDTSNTKPRKTAAA